MVMDQWLNDAMISMDRPPLLSTYNLYFCDIIFYMWGRVLV